MKDRMFDFDGVSNFRDFGGYPTQDGRLVSHGRLFRSGTFGRCSEGDMNRLDQLNIHLVADLRRAPECDKEPSVWPTSSNVEVLSGPKHLQATAEPTFVTFLGQPGISPEETREFAIDAFRKIVFDPLYLHLFGEALKAISRIEGAVVVHCTHGKDRTGLLCALIHHILGVPIDLTLDDFELTNVALDLENGLADAHEAFMQRYKIDVAIEVLEPMLGVNSDYLLAALEAMSDGCGSIDAYLDQIGVNSDVRKQMHRNFIADN